MQKKTLGGDFCIACHQVRVRAVDEIVEDVCGSSHY